MKRDRAADRREQLEILSFVLKVGAVAFAAAMIQSFLEARAFG